MLKYLHRLSICKLRKNVRGFGKTTVRLQPSQLAQLSPYDVNQVLRENEFVFNFPEDNNSVIRSYESNQLGSNIPCEDSRTEASLVHRNGFLCGIFDGHGGAACGQVVSKRLLRYISAATLDRDVLRSVLEKGCDSQSFLKCHNDKVDFVSEIQPIYEASFKKYLTQIANQPIKSVNEELETAFLQLDNDIANEALERNDVRTMAVALSGAVACIVHIENLNLHVASTGDCGAVLGVQCPESGQWTSKKLNVEHNADNLKEVDRILSEHPPAERETVIRNQRLLSQLAPLRAFGDFRYKWPLDVIERVVAPIVGEHILPPHYYTPPYLTAQPEVQHHVLSTQDKFLVLASDGLWDFLSPSEVVSLVGEHISSKKVLEPLRLPEGDIKLQQISDILAERKAGRTRKPIDQNAATHLIRYALGATDYGIEHSKISYYLSLPKDIVRLYRDDITITVLYFNTSHISKLTSENGSASPTPSV